MTTLFGLALLAGETTFGLRVIAHVPANSLAFMLPLLSLYKGTPVPLFVVRPRCHLCCLLPFVVAKLSKAEHRAAHDDGEVATARAASADGTLMAVSSSATTSLEDVASAGGPGMMRWLQLSLSSRKVSIPLYTTVPPRHRETLLLEGMLQRCLGANPSDAWLMPDLRRKGARVCNTPGLTLATCRAAGNMCSPALLSQTRAIIAQLVGRAIAAGYTALVVTGDRPILGRREADIHNRYELAARLARDRVVSSTGARVGPLDDGSFDLVSKTLIVNCYCAHFYADGDLGHVQQAFDTPIDLSRFVASEQGHAAEVAQTGKCLNWGDISWLRSICGNLKVWG